MGDEDTLGQEVQPGFKYMPRPERAATITNRVDFMCQKLEENYVRQKKIKKLGGIYTGLRLCSFFDPTVPNGGPRPVEEGAADQHTRDVWAMLEELESGNWMTGIERQVQSVLNEEHDRHRRDLDYDDDDAFIDPFDQAEDEYSRTSIIQVRLSPDVGMAWRQIATAYRKWILRYMAECRGQIHHQLHTRRLIKVAAKINKLTFEVNGVKPIDFTRAVWRNVGYEVTDAPEGTTATLFESTTSA